MSDQDRGAFTSDQVRIFDGSEDDDEDQDGSRLPLLIVIALVVLASFAGVVWLAYEKGVASGRNELRIAAGDADAPPVTPDSAPPPSQYKALKIYEQPAPDNADAGPPAVSAPKAESSAPDIVLRPPVSDSGTNALPHPKPNAPQKTATASPPHEQFVVASAPPASSAPPAPLQAAAPAAAESVTTGYVLQIGSYKSQAEADQAWAAAQKRYAGMLTGTSPDVKKVTLGSKGTWYRLRVASFQTKDEAGALCQKLKAAGGNCLIAR